MISNPGFWLLALALLLASQLLFRLPVFPAFGSLLILVRRSKRLVFAEKVSDHWKEKAAGALSIRLMIAGMRLFGLLVLVALPVLIVTAVEIFQPIGILEAAADGRGRLTIAAIAIAAILISRRISSDRA